MGDPAVLFDGVWKKYRRGERHDSLRDLIWASGARLLRRPRPAELGDQEFWALRDVSFTVGPGDALGIIGPNGAGKSTVLKLLTRISRPTRGRAALTGRVGALIEVAAGFHPDLTGRQNVQLQGAIMGMRQADIAQRFDEIVAFAGLDEFIDTPVKRYSSGMNARLGFAIAAHLEPDVLIVDEVLSVGDHAFQEKAFNRLRAITNTGIPVVVVSHQLERVALLCNQAVLLDRGEAVHQGSPNECIARYLLRSDAKPTASISSPVVIESLSLGSPPAVPSGGAVALSITGRVVEGSLEGVEPVGVRVRALQTGQLLFATSTTRLGIDLTPGRPFCLALDLQMNLPPGVYRIEAIVWDRLRNRELAEGPSLTVQVQDGPSFWGTVQLNPRITVLEPAGPSSAR